MSNNLITRYSRISAAASGIAPIIFAVIVYSIISAAISAAVSVIALTMFATIVYFQENLLSVFLWSPGEGDPLTDEEEEEEELELEGDPLAHEEEDDELDKTSNLNSLLNNGVAAGAGDLSAKSNLALLYSYSNKNSGQQSDALYLHILARGRFKVCDI